MLSDFLHAERQELINRCKSKALLRPNAGAQAQPHLQHGIPEFLDQLIRTLRMDATPADERSARLSGLSGAWRSIRSDLGEAAALHGRELFAHGYSVEAVVHDYGDLCQAVTELAGERDVSIAVSEFRTLNRCLDNAIADAVKEYGYGHKVQGENATLALNERYGSFVHELRNHLNTATLAFALVRGGRVTPHGATGQIVDRSLAALGELIERAIVETRTGVAPLVENSPISLSDFIATTHDSALLQAQARGCVFATSEVDPSLAVHVDPVLLSGALSNLLANAFKFTSRGTTVCLDAYAAGDRILIAVSDHCGGIPAEALDSLFQPFVQRSANREGLGLGLPICRKYVEACEGTLAVRNIPGEGCVFTIDLPRHRFESSPPFVGSSVGTKATATAAGGAL